MKKVVVLLAMLFWGRSVFSQPVYDGHDLGVHYSPSQTTFKIWAPTATAVRLRLYRAGEGDSALQVIALDPAGQGVWKAAAAGDLAGQYYTFQTFIDGKWLMECPDIYARAVGVNGHRGMIVDMAATNPA